MEQLPFGRRPAPAVVGHKHAYLVCRYEDEQALEGLVVGGATVGEELLLVQLHLRKPVGHATDLRGVAEVPRVHVLCGAGLQDLRRSSASVLQMGDHKAGHIGRGGAHAPGRSDLGVFKGLGLVRCSRGGVARGQAPGEACRQRLLKGAVAHLQRFEDARLDILLERDARHLLDDIAGQRGAIVGIGGDHAGRDDPRRQVTSEIRAQRDQVGSVRDGDAEITIFKPGSMSEQVGERNRLRVGRRDLEAPEIGVHVGMQVERALLDELHHGGPGDQLAERADAEERLLGIHRRAPRNVGVAIAFGKEQGAVLHHRHSRAGDLVALQLCADHAIQEALKVAGGG